MQCYRHVGPALVKQTQIAKHLHVGIISKVVFVSGRSPCFSKCSYLIVKVKVSFYIAQYRVRRTAQSALHFTPWQTSYFTLHPLADLLLYPSPPGRPGTLPFTPWQTCYFTLNPLADLFIPRPSQLIWELFSHDVIAARRLLVQYCLSLYVCSASSASPSPNPST